MLDCLCRDVENRSRLTCVVAAAAPRQECTIPDAAHHRAKRCGEILTFLMLCGIMVMLDAVRHSSAAA